MKRRRFVELTGAAVATACHTRSDSKQPSATHGDPFSHGVASGDPLADRVMLWTRVSASDRVDVEWTVASDEALQHVVAHGVATTDASRDHTVKVDAGGLQPGTIYFYGFRVGEHRSVTGRTRTLPQGDTRSLQLAVCSCSNYPAGFFTVYAAIAKRDDLDAVLHVGDYIYEYADGVYGDSSKLGRTVEPLGECLKLADYRQRYASYRRDPDLQEVHRRHPMIAVWDDHEIANDTWDGGAENHDEDEGSFVDRRAAAAQAWREWMPARENPENPLAIHRSFRFGDLAELIVLDTRVIGRARQTAPEDLATRMHPERTLLGQAQEQWLHERMLASKQDGVAWRVLGQQVVMAQLRREDGHELDLDKWDGYPAARSRLFDFVQREHIEDLVVLTGDIHSSWAFELYPDPFTAQPGEPLAVEFVTPAVSSPPLARYEQMPGVEERHPHLRWVELQRRGYVTLALNKQGGEATWNLIADLDTPGHPVEIAKRLALTRGSARLRDTTAPT